MIGPPIGLNLRNLMWHGFLNMKEFEIEYLTIIFLLFHNIIKKIMKKFQFENEKNLNYFFNKKTLIIEYKNFIEKNIDFINNDNDFDFINNNDDNDIDFKNYDENNINNNINNNNDDNKNNNNDNNDDDKNINNNNDENENNEKKENKNFQYKYEEYKEIIKIIKNNKQIKKRKEIIIKSLEENDSLLSTQLLLPQIENYLRKLYVYFNNLEKGIIYYKKKIF
jgi:hypothetical protein